MNEKKDTLNDGERLCSVYCSDCDRVTDKISFNLLRQAGTLEATCPVCHNITTIEYDGKTAKLQH